MPRRSPRTRPTAIRVARFAATLGLVASSACAPAAGPPPTPDVLWISVDTLRADHLSTYGYGRETSPNLDALAAEGARFESCYSVTSWTLPSHLSMLTGLSISVHGIDDDRVFTAVGRPGAPEQVPLRGVFASEVLAAAGYRTAGFFSWKYLESRFGFGPGFESWERVGGTVYSDPELVRRHQRLIAEGAEEELERWRASEPEQFDFQRPTDAFAVDAGLEWLRETDGDSDPRLLFLHLFDPHDAYVPAAPFKERFADPSYRGPIDGRNVSSPDSPVRPSMSGADLEQLKALYDGEIAWTDSQLGRLFEHLDSSGTADDTLVMVTSDHGEEFFEHGGKTHRAQLFAESTRVPWLLRWPAAIPSGRAIEGPVGLVDLAPTLYGLLGLDAPAGLSGSDLSPVVLGRTENAARTYSSLLLRFGDSYRPDRDVVLRREQRTFLFKHRRGHETELWTFDRSENPTESGPGVPLRTDDPLAERANGWLKQLRTDYRQQRALAYPRRLDSAPLSASEISELAAMGYVTGLDTPQINEAPGPEGDGAPNLDRLAIDGGFWPSE